METHFLDTLFHKIKETLSQGPEAVQHEELAGLQKIMDELNYLPVELARYLAAFSFILFRVAYADSEVSESETHKIESILKEWGGLRDTQAALVARIACAQNHLFGGTENYLVTREFKEISTGEQKVKLLHSLFAVAASDDSITSVESDTIRMIANELGLSHDDFIAERRNFVDKLEALK